MSPGVATWTLFLYFLREMEILYEEGNTWWRRFGHAVAKEAQRKKYKKAKSQTHSRTLHTLSLSLSLTVYLSLFRSLLDPSAHYNPCVSSSLFKKRVTSKLYINTLFMRYLCGHAILTVDVFSVLAHEKISSEIVCTCTLLVKSFGLDTIRHLDISIN